MQDKEKAPQKGAFATIEPMNAQSVMSMVRVGAPFPSEPTTIDGPFLNSSTISDIVAASSPVAVFPLFPNLPIELRHGVWRMLARIKVRVLPVTYVVNSTSGYFAITNDSTAIHDVNDESRTECLRLFTLLRGQGLLRSADQNPIMYAMPRDVLFLTTQLQTSQVWPVVRLLLNDSELNEIERIAFQLTDIRTLPRFLKYILLMPKLREVYLTLDDAADLEEKVNLPDVKPRSRAPILIACPSVYAPILTFDKADWLGWWNLVTLSAAAGKYRGVVVRLPNNIRFYDLMNGVKY